MSVSKKRSMAMKSSWARRKIAKGVEAARVKAIDDAEDAWRRGEPVKKASDGSTASYYELPPDAKELQDLISYRNMNSQLGEIFRAAYRYGECPHSPKLREIKKIIFYAHAELARLEKYHADGET